MTSSSCAGYIAEMLKSMKEAHKAKFNCPLNKKRCNTCDLVACIDLFTPKTSMCKECYRKKQKEYHEIRVKAREKETGEPRKPRGRPRRVIVDDSKSKKKTTKKKKAAK
jgi:hypothetical protein